MLKLKPSLLALSVSMSLFAVQSSYAAPFAILPLGDSITNGIHNDSVNKLAYRDDLFDKLSVLKYDFKFVGRCPDTGDDGGSCQAPSTYKGRTLNHEGRAGYHADQIRDNLYNVDSDGNASGWLTWYTPNVVLLHIGTNDIFDQDNDVNKSNNTVEALTYSTTLTEIEGIISKLKEKETAQQASYPGFEMKIYVAKILPMGMVRKANGDKVLYNDGVGDAAKGLNDLMTPTWAEAKGVTVIDQNYRFNFNDHFDSGKIHPNQAAEYIMSYRWSALAIQNDADFSPEAATGDKSTLVVSSDPVSADNTATATVTLEARFPSGNQLGSGADPVAFSIKTNTSPSGATMTTVIDNEDGTYTTTVKSSEPGQVVIGATINGQNITTGDATISFVVGQTLSFSAPAEGANIVFGDAAFDVTAESSSGLDVVVTSLTDEVCSNPDATTGKVTILKAGECKLEASQQGGEINGITYAAAAPVERVITIAKANQAITFATNTPTTLYKNGTFTASATSTSGEPAVITSTDANTCSINASNLVTIKVASGVCRLKAVVSETDNYNMAIKTHTIGISETITLPTIPDKEVGDKAFTVTAKSSSGAAVTLEASPTNVCTVSGSTVSIGKSAGTCTLTAKTANGASETVTFKVKKNASQLAIEAVGKVIASGQGSITFTQLNLIKGLKNLEKGADYTKALIAGTYADKNNPTVAELQTVIDKVNKDNNKSGGSTSALWLLMLGFVSLIRRKLSLGK